MIKSMLLCSFSSFQFIPISHTSSSSVLHSYPSHLASNQRFLHPNINTSRRLQRKFGVLCNSIPSGLPSGVPPSGSCWKSWVLGIAITIVLPFLTNKWGPLLKIKNEVDTVVETAERVAEEVEKVAEQVEKVSEELADDLPEGKLKNAASLVEHLAESTEKNAKLVDDFIDKVQAIEEKVDKLVESSTGQVKTDISNETSELDEAKEKAEDTKL